MPTARSTRWRTGGRSASRCTSCSRSSCTLPSSAGTTDTAPPRPPPACEHAGRVSLRLSHCSAVGGTLVSVTPDPTAQRQHVLVVEDDRAVRESLRRSLEFNGYLVSTASDGAEALAGISGINPDAVVMDVMMPRL